MRHLAYIFGAGVALLVVVGLVAFALEDSTARVAAIQKCFGAIPNVKVTYITDLEKQASQAITADVHLAGMGDLSFTGLESDSFDHPKHVYLHGIGPFVFRTRERTSGHESYGYAIDIGPESPIPAAKRLMITNVQSAISNYDRLLAVFAQWPVITGEWPTGWPPKAGQWDYPASEEVHFSDLPRGDYYSCLKRVEAGNSR